MANNLLKKTKKFFVVLLSLLIFTNINNLLANDIVVKNQSDHGLTIVFTPQDWRILPETKSGNPYYKLDFKNSNSIPVPGNPEFPIRTVLIGIPFESKVSLEIQDNFIKKTLDGKILPVPQIGGDGLGNFQFQENASTYQSNSILPSQTAEISSPKIMRDLQVITLTLYPVQFEPLSEKIYLYRQLVVRVNFLDGKQETNIVERSEDRFLYNNILANPTQAAKWRKRSKRIHKQSETKYWGNFYKIYVNEDGIYKISGSELEEAGLILNNVNPGTIKIYNNGGLQLPQNLHDPRPDGLIENSILVEDGGDGSFEKNDYILFFGKSVKGWKYDQDSSRFSHYLHSYTRENIYWLDWQDLNPGKRIQKRNVFTTLPVTNVTEFLDFIYVENEFKNLLNSGTCWLGNYFSTEARQRIYQFNLKGAVPNRPTAIRMEVAGISNHYHQFVCYCNDVYFERSPGFYGSTREQVIVNKKYFSSTINSGLVDGYNKIKIDYQITNDASLAYMDWIELDYYRQLMAVNDLLEFYSPDSTGIFKYSVQSFSTDNIFVFDVSLFNDVSQIQNTTINNGTVEFFDTTSTNIPKRYLTVTPEKFKKVLNITKDVPSNWRSWQDGADFIIITYDDFYDAVLPLKSLRENCDSLKTVVVKISDVFDEFSCGLTDPTAIRDFIKFTFENWQPRPAYVLLFGDGDYDYKNYLTPNDPNWIPPFETSELNENTSRARDDWYVCVSGDDDLMDLAIGRIPAKSFDQAINVVKKIIEYKNNPQFGEWSNTIVMAADDEFWKGLSFDPITDHIPTAEYTCENYIPKSFNIKKIYLTEYPAVKSASISGIRKPKATEALLRQINDGCLIFNFIGHANEDLLAHERLLHISDDFPRIENGSHQALWIAATCDFGKWDNPYSQSFAEELINADGRGAIATFTSCRNAYPDPSVSLNRNFYDQLFSSTRQVRLGDAVMAAKNSRGNYINDQIYHLLGDPTLTLNMPTLKLQITDYSPDSIRALTKMKVQGAMDSLSSINSSSDGNLIFTAYDSRIERNYHVTGNRYFKYKLPGNSIFRGAVSKTNNEFVSQFIVPKDITYGGNEGRFSVLYWDESKAGSGFVDGIPVGGTETNFVDKQGPLINIGFTGINFLPGGLVSPNSELEIKIEDKISGINIAGDIGHKIILMLDDNEKIDVTDYFQYDLDSYTVGKIRYPMMNINEGSHEIRIKAWDNNNNSSFTETNFTVVADDQLVIRDLLNYPNPFSDGTEFTFWINLDSNVEIKIYTLSGRLIRTINNLQALSGFNHFYWDGLDQDQDLLANGVYLYKLSARSSNGTQRLFRHEIQKCVVVR